MNADDPAVEFVAYMRSGATLVIHPDDLNLMVLLVEAMMQKRIVKSEQAERGKLIAYHPNSLPDLSEPPTNWH